MKIILYGDSLMAGYGLPEQEHLSSQLEMDLKFNYNLETLVVNGSVSGDTSSSGLNRIEWTLQDSVDLVILSLGANDMLRGIDPKVIKYNLQKIINIIQEKNIDIIIAGMQSPKSYGDIYKTKFDNIYFELAKENNLLIMPFLLEGVALNPALNQSDGKHPNFQGIKIISENLSKYINQKQIN